MLDVGGTAVDEAVSGEVEVDDMDGVNIVAELKKGDVACPESSGNPGVAGVESEAGDATRLGFDAGDIGWDATG